MQTLQIPCQVDDDDRTVGRGLVREEARKAAAAVVPLLFAYIPFGLVVGARVGDGGDVLARWTSSWLIMGGSAQLAVLEMIDTGASVALVVGTGLLINARLVAYSTSLAPEWAGASRRYRALAAASVIDPTWALAQRRIQDGGTARQRRVYYAAAAGMLCTGWVGIITVGAVVGGTGGLESAEIAVPLCLVALVAPHFAMRAERAPLAVAAVVAWFGAELAAGAGIVLAAVAAVVVAAAGRRHGPGEGQAS